MNVSIFTQCTRSFREVARTAGGVFAFILCLCCCTAFGANLLTNPDFESGQTGWSGAVRGSGATVITNPAVAHGGNNCISNYNAGGWSSASQGDSRGGWSTGVTIPVSDAKFYRLSAYVKVPGASSTPQDITLRYRFESSGNRVDVGQQTISTESWTLLQSGWVAPGAGDTYMSYWEVHSVANAVVFYADDCSLEESDGATITGVVKDDSNNAVVGAQVQLKLTGTVIKTTTSGAGGAYTFHVEPVAGNAYTLNASKLNYSSPGTDVDVTTVAPPGVATAPNIILTALPTVIVSGGVTNGATGLAVADATVTVLGSSGSQTTVTGNDGKYSLTVAANENYILTARKLPLSAPAQYITPSANQTVDFTLSSALLVGIYAENLSAGSLNSWTNTGTLGGEFVKFGATGPVAGQAGIYRSVQFNDNPMILTNRSSASLITAPAEITGSTASYTVNAWLYDPDSTLPDQQTYISWAKRGGPDGSNCEMGYGVNGSYGAAGHWGSADMGFATPPTGAAWHNVVVTWDYTTGIESLYIDGVLSKNSPSKSLDIGAGLPIVLGSGYWYDTALSTISATDIPFGASIAQLEIFSAPASAEEIARFYTNTVPVAHATATLQGQVLTTDSSVPSGFAITATGSGGAIAAQAVSATDGSYSLIVPPGTFTVKAIKTGYITMPAPQSRTVVAGETATLGNFTATASTISGKLVDAITGAGINNGIVQVGGKGGQAMVTDQTGAYSLPATGCGGFELFADALNYHCRNLQFTNAGNLTKKIALTAEVETGGVTNGGFEEVVGGMPASWMQGWDPTAPSTISQFWATNVPYSGTNSAFVTGPGFYEPMSQFIPSDPAFVYNCYFKAISTNMASAGAVWFPMFAFRDNTFGEMKGWISGEPAPYEGWSHNAPTNWMQYLQFHTYSGDATQPFVRIAPPAGASWLSATFCFTDVNPTQLTTDQGVFVDDVVMDKVPAIVPLEAATPDPTSVALTVERVGSGIRLIWPQGTLLESPTVNGPWTTNSATSPYTNATPTGNMFYRLILQ